ncbi:MAG: hypothetical protein LBT18_02670 [Endomicrobium sp.]|jgi:hypothetical protein|nr:hypothetical protein [Endomicrobium sp.]
MKIKLLVWFVTGIFFLNTVSPAFSAPKKDVRDPVLREIINELGSKMPKFTNKYGDSVFVEDEPLTRGAFISALYEYDKKIKGSIQVETSVNPKGQLVSRQEFDSLKNKVSLLEKTGLSLGSGTSKDVDIVKIISDLEPNMPMLLDNSLRNSKVFKELQQQVLDNSGSGTGSVYASATPSQKEVIEIKKSLLQIQSSYVALSKRINDLGLKGVNRASASSGDINVDYFNKQLDDIRKVVVGVPSANDLQREIDKSKIQVRADIERIEKRLSHIFGSSKSSVIGESSSGSRSSTKIATLSLGLTMIAALFVSR